MRTIFPNKKALIDQYIHAGSRVLDVGFSGQGVQKESPNWPHALLKNKGAEVWGVDLEIDRESFPNTERYQEESAESFSFPEKKFDVIFAGDLIEHLPNPGLFLTSCAMHMEKGSNLIITTPNCFNLFNLAEKITKDEPTVNHDHTAYFNHKILTKLLEKRGFKVVSIGYIYSLEYTHKESWKKRILNVLYWITSLITPKYIETLVVVAKSAT